MVFRDRSRGREREGGLDEEMVIWGRQEGIKWVLRGWGREKWGGARGRWIRLRENERGC